MPRGLQLLPAELWGAALLAASLTAASAGLDPIASLLHPFVGAGVVLLADGLLERRRGASPLSAEPQAMVWMATLSIFIWVAVEALNDRRGLWAYLGWPADDLLRYAALGAAFATILPFLALCAEWLSGAAAWERRQPNKASTAAALLGLALYALAVRGPLPGDNSAWITAGVVGLFLAGGGLRFPPQRLAAWAAAGCLWIGISEAANTLATGERFLISPDGFSPILWPAALLLGPALGGLYQEASARLGLTAWPPQEASRSFDTILS